MGACYGKNSQEGQHKIYKDTLNSSLQKWEKDTTGKNCLKSTSCWGFSAITNNLWSVWVEKASVALSNGQCQSNANLYFMYSLLKKPNLKGIQHKPIEMHAGKQNKTSTNENIWEENNTRFETTWTGCIHVLVSLSQLSCLFSLSASNCSITCKSNFATMSKNFCFSENEG